MALGVRVGRTPAVQKVGLKEIGNGALLGKGSPGQIILGVGGLELQRQVSSEERRHRWELGLHKPRTPWMSEAPETPGWLRHGISVPSKPPEWDNPY